MTDDAEIVARAQRGEPVADELEDRVLAQLDPEQRIRCIARAHSSGSGGAEDDPNEERRVLLLEHVPHGRRTARGGANGDLWAAEWAAVGRGRMIGGSGLTTPHDVEIHDYARIPPVCGVCGHPVWRDEAGAWEHTEAGDLRGSPPVASTITPRDLPRLFPCDLPVPHDPHRREITDGDVLGGYRCDGNGGIVLPIGGHDGATVEYVHFHGCPTPEGEPFGCDYCQARAASMGGEG